MLYVQSWTPDDGRKDRPKHVEGYSVSSKIVHLVGFTIEKASIQFSSLELCPAAHPLCLPHQHVQLNSGHVWLYEFNTDATWLPHLVSCTAIFWWRYGKRAADRYKKENTFTKSTTNSVSDKTLIQKARVLSLAIFSIALIPIFNQCKQKELLLRQEQYKWHRTVRKLQYIYPYI
jgi:hypothetical protein